jgi:hypothetical protein
MRGGWYALVLQFQISCYLGLKLTITLVCIHCKYIINTTLCSLIRYTKITETTIPIDLRPGVTILFKCNLKSRNLNKILLYACMPFYHVLGGEYLWFSIWDEFPTLVS